LEAIRERTRSSQKKLRELGRWGGGVVYYGFKPVEHPTSAGWVWERDEYSSGVLLDIIDQVLERGRSTEQVSWELNQKGILAPSDYHRQRYGREVRGTKWSNAAIRDLLRNRAMLGHVLHKGVTVRDEQGEPVRKGPPLVSQDLFNRLQTALDVRAFKVTRTRNASPLLGVAICLLCERLMHYRQHDYKDRKGVKNGVVYRYYQCIGGKQSVGNPDHPANVIKAEDLEELVEQTFLETYGHENVKEQIFIPAESHQTELEEAMRAVDELTSLLGTITSDTMRSRLTEQLRALDSRITQLETLPTSESRWEWREMLETYAEAWKSADTDGRRQLLLKRKVSAKVAVRGKVGRTAPGSLEVHLIADDVTPTP
jgi:site-specific DNA recombinase